MKAYNSDNILNDELKKKAKIWYAEKLISEKQYFTISNSYNSNSYSPNIFVKIGLFVFTIFIILAVLGIFSLVFSSLMFNSSNSEFITFTCLFFAAACFTVLELFINSKRNTGSNDALLYAGIIFLAEGLYLITDLIAKDSFLFFILILLPFISFSVFRYADRIATLFLVLCVYTLIFLTALKLGDIAKQVIPFLIMIFSGILYFQTKKTESKPQLFYWRKCIIVSEFAALLVFYIACNYYVIRETGVSYFNLQLREGQDIPLAFLFYTLTAIVPVVYIYFGLRQKDKILLWSGLLLVAASAITFKYYFSVGHPEITLTIAGLVLIAVAYIAMKYFKKPKYGITFEEEKYNESSFKSNVEALIILGSINKSSETNSSPEEIEFGGGQSGGAGSGGSY